jgi:hypothetical protein
MTTPKDETAAGSDKRDATEARRHFDRTLIRVMAVQVAALIALWLLQARYAW